MKTLLIAFSLMLTMVACNKGANTEYKEQKQEANKEYRENMDDVREDAKKAEQKRNQDIEDAQEELHKKQVD